VAPSARPSNWRTDRDQVYALGDQPSKLLPSEYKAVTTPVGTKICQDAIRSQALYTSTVVLCNNPCGMLVSLFPLVYKRRRRTPGCRGDDHPHSLAHAYFLDIGTRLNHLAGTWRLRLLSRLACIPLYEHHGALQHSATSTNLLDVRPHGRNHDKPASPCCSAPAIERPIIAHFTS
jgi:hypothetical protein